MHCVFCRKITKKQAYTSMYHNITICAHLLSSLPHPRVGEHIMLPISMPKIPPQRAGGYYPPLQIFRSPSTFAKANISSLRSQSTPGALHISSLCHKKARAGSNFASCACAYFRILTDQKLKNPLSSLQNHPPSPRSSSGRDQS